MKANGSAGTAPRHHCSAVNAVLVILCVCQGAFLISENKLTKSLYKTVATTLSVGSNTEESLSVYKERGIDKDALSSSRTYLNNKNSKQKTKAPNWMIAVDCSSFDQSCASYAVAAQRYAPYPFPFVYGANNSSNFELLGGTDGSFPSWLTTESDSLHPFELRHNLTTPSTPNTQQHLDSYYTLNQYPPQVPQDQYMQCVATGVNTPYEQQLDTVLKSLEQYTTHGLFDYDPTVKADSKNKHLVSFTISDYKYTYDTMHSFFQMSWDLVTMGHNSVMMVALDVDTLQMACRYGYPVVLVGSRGDNSTKTMVQNTKFLLSRDIVERGYNYWFYEMDVWWIQSPLEAMRQTIQHRRRRPEYGMDIVVSGHQDNPKAHNIGFYAVQANERTKEFFRELYTLIELRPNVFDQFAFGELFHLESDAADAEAANDASKLATLLSGNFTHERWETGPNELPVPKLQHILKNQVVLDGSFIAAHEWPIIHERTLAIHPLCGAPLRSPNGKKILAKELGAWYGYRSMISPNHRKGDTVEKDADEAGYYTRRGRQNRRYIMLDGKAWMSHDALEAVDDIWGFYHANDSLTMTITLMIAIARQTNRILILPKVFHDRGAAFLWIGLDLQSLEGVVEFRETNFINNPKAWFSEDQPFESYARTALGTTPRNPDEIKLYGKPRSAVGGDGSEKIEKWRFPRELKYLGIHFIDVWLHMMTSIGYDDAELLLVNPQFLFDRKIEFSKYQNASPIMREIWQLYGGTIKWCIKDNQPNNVWSQILTVWPAGRVRAQDDCYGQGNLLKVI